MRNQLGTLTRCRRLLQLDMQRRHTLDHAGVDQLAQCIIERRSWEVPAVVPAQLRFRHVVVGSRCKQLQDSLMVFFHGVSPDRDARVAQAHCRHRLFTVAPTIQWPRAT